MTARPTRRVNKEFTRGGSARTVRSIATELERDRATVYDPTRTTHSSTRTRDLEPADGTPTPSDTGTPPASEFATFARLPELDAEAIYLAVERKKRGLRMSWRRVSIESGVSLTGDTTVWKRLGRGHVPGTPNLLLMLLWEGRTDLRTWQKQPVA